jgi:hypothetical protein
MVLYQQTAWQIQTPICLLARKQRLILEWEAEKSTYVIKVDVTQKAIGGTYLTNIWRPKTSEPALEFDNFEPRA